MRNAFSLVELSIVLVILGLLTGGILAGQSLIRASQMRTVSTDYQRYATATQTFRDKFFSLPGDMTNATAFWGAMTNCNVASPSGSGTQTCNGNGDGSLSTAVAASQTGEVFMYWQQLANAGLVEGTYTGIAGAAGNNDSVSGVNAPPSKLSNAQWAAHSSAISGHCTAGARYTAIVGPDNYNYLVLGGDASGVPSGMVLKPEEAWNIDTKMDDAKPGMGTVKGLCATFCSDLTDAATAQYALTTASSRCWLIMAL